MPNLRLSFLTPQDLPQVRATFLKAFADYVVPVQLSEEQLRDKVEREGIVPEFCVAAFDGEEMAGFILTALGDWQGMPTAYNAGTGVVPTYRGQGLTQQMYAFLLPKLREKGVRQCLLEVIEGNVPALKTYEKIGFYITRTLSCFRALKQDLLQEASPPAGINILEATQPDFAALSRFWDVQPTWQNSIASLNRSINQDRTLEARAASGEVVGYISVFRKNGAVAQLAVSREWRGKGIGTALLRAAMQQVEAPSLMFINVEDTAQSMISFLQGRDINLLLKQHEMLMPIPEKV
ncbi:GNAT family N-acetyltransferase [Pontibacter chinhatensis]|uniref:Ribosomal protein S18 acetylase RimI n=1 Tax=Pontibacter chinhatensis TaxID=1436961 RepID=A0A1I2VFC3_9BACT|nr:GNAT family N-acetyltransferase [Pontibacter chinhatensis]SFG88008.1 Ribosomal protein S18 acetylase RimI [Pontibacter chinhatensis]